jgi:adenylosuccinate lyase
LDDSANRRIVLGEAFLAADVILSLVANITDGIAVYPKVIHSRIMAELPFMATENIIMEGVKNGGDRQELHEEIRVMSMEAGKVVKEEGKDNDLLERILKNEVFQKLGITEEKLKEILDLKKFVGRAPGQVVKFIQEEVSPAIQAIPEWNNIDAGELKV